MKNTNLVTSPHNFHIPVMGIGFTVDTPLKVAPFGIDSVIFISDDILLEKMRKMYAEKNNISYSAISDKQDDARAKRVTAYLDLIHDLIHSQVERMCSSEDRSDLEKYFDLLPDDAPLIHNYFTFLANNPNQEELKDWLIENLIIGKVDVNIMTKLDKQNYKNKERLETKYNDAHAALRGFANSKLNASVVFSAGMNPKLYSYAEQLPQLFPDADGNIEKKIILKVSDYRSAMIQGKFLAKKGLWVSEYRIESGLNCGGHAFATEGFLMGPILEEFKRNRQELTASVRTILDPALKRKNITVPETLPLRITAQGGVGTHEEHQFLLDRYELDSVGWGSPFLLVPEATTVDAMTLDKLMKAKEKDLYLSNISPLGVPFNNLKGNSKDIQRLSLIAKGRPGSACPKKYLSINKEFTDQPICTASRQYQHLKLNQIKDMLSEEEYQKEYQRIVESSCLCVGLGTTPLIVNDIERKVEGNGVLICPGPNMAYFSKIVSLKKMVAHIYGHSNIIERHDRPNMFLKELGLYVEYLKEKCSKTLGKINEKERNSLVSFIRNLREGIDYYYDLFSTSEKDLSSIKKDIFIQLKEFWADVDIIEEIIEKTEPEIVTAKVS